MTEDEFKREVLILQQGHAQQQQLAAASAAQPAIKKKAKAMKSSKEKAQLDRAPRNIPVPLTEAQLDEVESRAREKLPEAFAQGYGYGMDQMETEEPEGEPSRVEIIKGRL